MPYIRKTTDIFISPEMESVLHQIQSKSEVASLLLKSRIPNEILVDNPINYIGVSSSDCTKISYLPKERFDTEDVWRTSKRIFCKPGAFVKKIFKDISEREVENFSTLYRNVQTTPVFEMKIVEGEELRKWYYYENYYDQSSSLGASCMKHRSCQRYMELYVKNPNKIKMLCMVNGDRLIGRALLWYGMSVDGTSYNVLDRIYTVCDEDYVFHFRKWADDNGFLYKKEQKWNNTLFFLSKDSETLKRGNIVLDNIDFESYPYMDTFKFLDKSTKTLYNYLPKDLDNIITISLSDGGYAGDEYLCEDGITHLYCYRNEMTFVRNRDIWTVVSNVVYSSVFDVNILRDDAVYSDELRDWIYVDPNLNNMDMINQLLEKNQRSEDRIRSIRDRHRDRASSSMYTWFEMAADHFIESATF
jgi:hypothetical protein